MGLQFTSATDGRAFGPDLFATTDGGRTWRRDPAQVYYVQSISVSGSTSPDQLSRVPTQSAVR